jgi:hypothetical protein
MAARRISFEFGALADPLDEQLERQGIVMDCSVLQRDADSISRLYVRGLLTEAETDRAQKRLRSHVIKCIQTVIAPKSA